ncbi:unnamed protein product [Parascedosporium putredinis]|uniref:MFS general substrate transporter n=1 Tax=Parascedosporium putredinis TaxID=1442378 RepID=A0A9P1GWJ3_9PEZI|nr:unnamed protein product [Parascedosporium putredinis]CAI7989590.1 unnamed protein product [Parascedosporium putredinis]
MAADSTKSDPVQNEVENVEPRPQTSEKPRVEDTIVAEAHEGEDAHIKLSWRSWLVVAVTCFAVVSQVFVVVAAGPLLMQAVLSPLFGRLSDVLERKYLAGVPPLIAFVGAVISAKATSMNMLVGGGYPLGDSALKYRPIAQGFCGMAGTIGGLIGSLGAGAVTNVSSDGWREYPKMTLKEYIWTCDPIGSFLFITGSTLTILGLNWSSGVYGWSDVHVIAPLTIGLVMLLGFGIYEWKGRDDGLVAHVFFQHNANFFYTTFAFAIEGWIFYSAVNSFVPQIVLNLGFEHTAWDISVRQLYFKDLKNPLLVTFIIFLAVTIFYACIRPDMDKAQIAINVFAGIGQAGPLTLLPAAIQYTAPHAFLSTATGLAFSARAIGGAMAPPIADLLTAMASGVREGVEGATDNVWAAAAKESANQYAAAYRLAWASIIPFVVIAIVCIWFMRGVEELMTDKIEATVERVAENDEEKSGKKGFNLHL